MTVSGTCHCGAVTVELARPPVSLTSCNCSICHKLGTLWAYCTPAEATIRGATSTYRWGDKTIDFHRCPTCGCATHWTPIPGTRDENRMGINARLFALEVVASTRIRRLDGASDDWKYLDD